LPAPAPIPALPSSRFSIAHRFPTLGGLGPILAVFLCGVFAFVDLYATQPLLPLLAQTYHASKAQVGLTISASTLGVAIAAPLLGIFAERIIRRRVILFSLFALVVPTLLAATSHSLASLIFWRFLQGVLIPGIFAMTITYVTEQWGADSVALVMSVYVSGSALGGFTGRLVTGLVSERMPWQTSFLFLGALTLLGALCVARWLPVERAFTPAVTTHANMLSHLVNARVMVTCWAGFNVLFSLVAVFTYVTFYLVAPPFRVSISTLSYLFVVYLVGLVATPAAGVLLPRIGLRAGMVAANLTSLAGVAITLAHQLPMVIIGLALMCTGVFISQACATSYLREATPSGGRAAAIGLYVCCYYIGGTAGGVIPSYAWKLGAWPACVALVASVQIITITVALAGWKNPVATEAGAPSWRS
jgi:predicted MFS family arabinose efflux permease